MEEQEAVWRIWVDTRRKVVSFHEEEGSQLMEFRSWEMFQPVEKVQLWLGFFAFTR